MSMIRTKRRKMMRHTTRRTTRRAVQTGPGLIPARLPAEQVKEVRMRLDTNDRRLLVAGLVQLLPAALRKDRAAWGNLNWEQQEELRPIRQLLERLRVARRGQPTSWAF